MNSDFSLDPILSRDCHLLGELHGTLLLLMDNALVPWFILVPRTGEVELCDLPEAVRQPLQAAVEQVSRWLREQWQVDKLNVAAIGNVVRQLHIHVVGRHRDDYCWPGVVWGRSEKQPYRADQVADIRSRVQAAFGSGFLASASALS